MKTEFKSGLIDLIEQRLGRDDAKREMFASWIV
jgi:hypothetical protein